MIGHFSVLILILHHCKISLSHLSLGRRLICFTCMKNLYHTSDLFLFLALLLKLIYCILGNGGGVSRFAQNIHDCGGIGLVQQQIWCSIFIFYYCHGILLELLSTAEH